MSSSSVTDSSNHLKTPERKIGSSEPNNSPDKKRSSWIQIPKILFPSESVVTKSPTKMTKESRPQSLEPASPPKPKPKFLTNMSQGVHDIASTLRRSTNVVAEDIFGAHKDPKKTTRSASETPISNDDQPKDIFSASLSDVLVDIGKDAMKFMRQSRRKTGRSTGNQTAGVVKASSAATAVRKLSTSPAKVNRKVSDLLEIDSNDIDSSKLSAFHVDQSQLINEEPLPQPERIHKGRIDDPKRRLKQDSRRSKTPPTFASKVEFMQSLTEMPEELLPDQNEQPNESISQPDPAKIDGDGCLDDNSV